MADSKTIEDGGPVAAANANRSKRRRDIYEETPFRLLFPNKWTDNKGHWHPGTATIKMGERVIATDMSGTEARKLILKLSDAYRAGFTAGKESAK